MDNLLIWIRCSYKMPYNIKYDEYICLVSMHQFSTALNLDLPLVQLLIK